MDAPPPLSDADLAPTPPAVLAYLHWQAEVIAALTRRIAEQDAQIGKLTKRVAELEAQLGKKAATPANSSLPPASTHPHDKPTPTKRKSKRRCGGQPGHAKHERPLIPSDHCDDVVPLKPSECRRCGRELGGTDPEPLRHQVWELPPIKPIVVEYQRHRLVCSCGTSTCAELPWGVPSGQAGPRLIAFAGLLMACFRQSKRRAAQFMSMVLQQPASPAWMVSLQTRVAEAVKPAYDELAEQLPTQTALHIDESPTKEATSKAWVWTFVAAGFTVFACRVSRGREVLVELLGEGFGGIVGCDRARMYWTLGRRQWCWAHLKRDFQALIDSPCKTAQRLGHDLMRHTQEMFALWQRVRDGTLSRDEFRDAMGPIRTRIDALLLRGYFNPRLHGVCAELVEHKSCLWTFVDVADIEPTNNAAEQALRHAVIWRKLSFGTQSESGSRFVERLLTVMETCRRQKRDVFAWLTAAVHAHLDRQQTPSLLLGV
jgi:transposase